MKQVITLFLIGFVSFGAMFFVVDKLKIDSSDKNSDLASQKFESLAGTKRSPSKSLVIRAPGKIEGRTETIELSVRIAEQIQSVEAFVGMLVSKGDELVNLDSERLVEERTLAEARLELALAKKQRLENGARKSEIEAASQDFEASQAPFWSADRAFERGISLFKNKAISQQELDDLRANAEAARARAAAAEARLSTLTMPARSDEVSAANAEIQAARSTLRISEINLKRAVLRAPIDGKILRVNAKVGELTGPDNPEPVVVMVDTSQIYAIAEVDEFDALNVELGQFCEITSDARHGVLTTGKIVEIEPQMLPKQMFGQWAGERSDSFSRRVRIQVDNSIDLPIGLPIEVAIQNSKPK